MQFVGYASNRGGQVTECRAHRLLDQPILFRRNVAHDLRPYCGIDIEPGKGRRGFQDIAFGAKDGRVGVHLGKAVDDIGGLVFRGGCGRRQACGQ